MGGGGLRAREAYRGAATAGCLVALLVGSACALSAQDSASAPRRAVVSGRVVGEGGKPIEGADVVIDTAWRTRTDASGRFRLGGIPVALHLMKVRAIGFQPLALDLHVLRIEEIGMTITLAAAPQMLPELVVTAQRQRLDRVGYYARRATGQGRFIEGDSLARLDAGNFVRALARVHGMRSLDMASLDPRPGSTACRRGFGLVVNGWVAPDEALYLRTMHPRDIDAVEIYEDAGIPNITPMALQSRGASAPDAESAPVSGAMTAAPSLGPPQASAGLAAAATRSLIQAARHFPLPTPTSCTIVVWERE